jgi:hypothetical protein
MKKEYFIAFLCIVSLISCNGIDQEIVPEEDIIELKVLNFLGDTEISEPLIGDGETIITLRAIIPAESAQRTITFKASNGATFVGIGENESTDLTNSEGIAETNLKLPLSGNPVYLSAEVTEGENTYISEKIIELIHVNNLISFELFDSEGNALPDIIRADGNFLINLKATVHFNQNEFNLVTFENSNGEFQNLSNENAQVNIDENNIASIDLKVPKVAERLYLKAKIGSNSIYFKEENIDLSKAFPDNIFIEPEKILMQENDSNSLDIFLTRENGYVSQDVEAIPFAFQIINGQEQEVGRFTGLENSATDLEGKINVTFKTDTGNFDNTLPIHIRVSARNDNNETLLTEVMINLN